jgi:replication factor C small subunit
MKSPLWIENYKPNISHFPQADVRQSLEMVVQSDMNLIVGGSKGVGKTVATEAILENIHQDIDNDVDFINITDLFNRNKKDLLNDDKFSQISSSRKNMSKRDLINDLIKEISSYPPVTGGFKTIVLDNAEKSRKDFQHSLRRTMERFSESTQFIFTTRTPSSLIEPLKSRCYTINIRPPSREELNHIVQRIENEENISIEKEGVDYIWSQTKPNVRRFLLHMQSTYVKHDNITPKNASEVLQKVSKDEEITSILEAVENENYRTAKNGIEELIEVEGYDPEFVIQLIIDASIRDLPKSESIKVCKKADQISYEMNNSIDPKTDIVKLLTSINK